jgi:phosphatidate cytidylyltransferase
MTRRILTAAILIPFVLASLLLFPLPAFLLIVSAVLSIALVEFSRLGSASGSKIYPVSYILAFIAPWIVTYRSHLTGPFFLAAVLITLVWCLFSNREMKTGFPNAAGNLLGLCYLAIPFSLIATFHHASQDSSGRPGRPYELILILVIVWVSDAAALFVGRAIGKHQITPSISPNKTLEGYLAALAFPVLTVVAIGGYLVPGKTILFLILASLIVAIAGVFGDLFESILKRGAEIKDTSTLIPGHGGVLDRIDSLLFAVPAYYLFALLLA